MIVVIGLGNIGLAIAQRFVLQGEEVCGVDSAADRRVLWEHHMGREAVGRLDEVEWQEVRHVFVVVRHTEQVVTLLGSLPKTRLHADVAVYVLTTLRYSFASNLERFAQGGLRLVELPVSGGADGALSGTLTVMAGGPLDKDGEDLLRRTIAKEVFRFDTYGKPTLAKLLNNVTAAYNALAFAEVINLGSRVGIEPHQMYEVVLSSSGSSRIAASFGSFDESLLAKDVDLLLDEVGDLPTITLNGNVDLVARLAEARDSLTGRG